MQDPQHHVVQCVSPGGLHQMHYTEWGERDNPRVVICVHGLSRNCRDFDTLAQTLATDCRVICPDVAGRGQSEWLADAQHYALPQYTADMTTLIARVTARGARDILWVGTSMGGMIGMLLASMAHTPIRRLVVNDVGLMIPKAPLERIGKYVGLTPKFNTMHEMNAYVRFISAPFGPLTDAQWSHLTIHNSKQDAEGRWTMNYDPGIAAPFQKGPIVDLDLTQYYDQIHCPTLLLRGTNSDLLLKDTALAMTQRGPKARLVEFAGIGHAPMLMADDQIKVVQEFLLT